MTRRAHTLCPECEHYPEVRIEQDGTVLRLVRSGTLAEVVRG